MTIEQILTRARALLEARYTSNGHRDLAALKQGAINLYAVVYGLTGPQVKGVATIGSTKTPSGYDHEWHSENVLFPALQGAVRNLIDDVESGVVGSLELRGAGVALADALQLAQEALRSSVNGSVNVAAVLSAAIFEDTLRRMAQSLAGIEGRPSLRRILTELKKAALLPGALGTTADGMIQFRNDALHANWAAIDRTMVTSCIAFTEGLLLKHFGQ